MSIAVYAGTFDPVTLGHLSVIRKAAGIFSHVRVLVAVNPDKHPMFSGKERVEMISAITKKMPQVTVDSTEGYVVDYAKEIGAKFLVRGIRNATDAAFEVWLAAENHKLVPEIETVLLPADPKLSLVSSSELKRRLQHNEPLDDALPKELEVLVRARMNGLLRNQ